MSDCPRKSILPDYDFSHLPLTYEGGIPESYRDEMGHMNTMWFTYIFTEATRRLCTILGMGPAYFGANHSGVFLLESHTRYLAEVHIGSQIGARSRMIARSEKRFQFMHFLMCGDRHKLAATVEYVVAHIDMTTRRMSVMPEHVKGLADPLIDQFGRVGWAPPLWAVMRP